MTALQATEKSHRIVLADALRGLALLFILIANVPKPENHDLIYQSRGFVIGSPAIDRTLEFITNLLIDKKFITIFSMLFGFGFFMQMKKAENYHVNFRSYYFRRMIVLFTIACIHAYLLWFGDIIRDYAICGIFLLLIYKWPSKRLLITAIVSAVFLTGTVFILNGVLELPYNYDTNIIRELPITDSYSRYLQINFTIDPFVNFINDSPLTLVFAFGVIVLGYWLAQKGFLQNTERFAKARKTLIILGFTMGIAASYVFWMINTGKLEMTPGLIWLPYIIVAGMLLQSLGYVSLFIQLFQSRYFRKILLIFEPVGKMALTNYVLQTIFYLLVFFHWTNGLKLFGKISLTETWLVSIVLFAIQIVFSKMWLRRHEQGPVEWLWKKIAYRG